MARLAATCRCPARALFSKINYCLFFFFSKKQTAEGEENEFKGCLEVSEMRRKEIEGSLKPEPLLVENPGRFVLFPIQDNEVSQHQHF